MDHTHHQHDEYPHGHQMDNTMNAYPQYMQYMQHSGQYPYPPMGYPAYPMQQQLYPQQQHNHSLLNERFFKGLLIGAAAAYVLTNENVQRSAIKGAVKAWSLLQGGVEELKERFHDAEAEIRSESGERESSE
jgi:hypothetical protein